MCIVFVEYRIAEDCRDLYLKWSEGIKRQHQQLELYEGTDQPNLFVEIWNGLSEEEYHSMKQERTGSGVSGEENDLWKPLDAWITGGRSKLHIWHFKKVK